MTGPKHLIPLLVIISMILPGCENYLTVSYNNPYVSYQGRIDTSGNSAVLMWPGTSVKINFEGEAVYALMKDEKGENYYNIILDNDSLILLRPGKIKKNYLLASDLPGGKHSVEVFKRTEWDKGKTYFYGFEIKGRPVLLPPDKEKKLKIEFYGNSITAGYAVEDYSGKDNPDSIFTNNYYSYAAETARRLNAGYRCISKGGIGIMLSWFPLTMPEMYNRLIPDDPASKWDFSTYTPDIVVINLLQNDSWLVNKPDHPEFKKKFGETPPDEKVIINSYKKFVSMIRKQYPDAKIICMLGNMDITKEGSPWPGFVKEAVRQLNDKNIFTLFVPYKNTPGHPKIEEQHIMADSLVSLIDRIE